MAERLIWFLFPRIVLASLILTFGLWGLSQADPHRTVTVPALAVSLNGGHEHGGVHYIAIQIDRDPQQRGPTILFNELSRGSAVGQDWKDGVHRAVAAAAAELGEDQRNWTVTIKNSTYSSVTHGSSASSAVAVGIMAAWRGDRLYSDVVLTGEITPAGQILEVGGLRGKMEGAAKGHMHTLLIPKGEASAVDFDLYKLAKEIQIKVIEVKSLREAYVHMTGKKP
ncbi:MAG: S16 family serine protease [Nitrospiraceae bacterium]